jgi:hypothetical protein
MTTPLLLLVEIPCLLLGTSLWLLICFAVALSRPPSRS